MERPSRPKMISFYEREKDNQRKIENLRLVRVICSISEESRSPFSNPGVNIQSVQMQNRIRIQKQIEFENKVGDLVDFWYHNFC